MRMGVVESMGAPEEDAGREHARPEQGMVHLVAGPLGGRHGRTGSVGGSVGGSPAGGVVVHVQ